MRGPTHVEGTLTQALGSVGVQRVESTESVGDLRGMILEPLSCSGMSCDACCEACHEVMATLH